MILAFKQQFVEPILSGRKIHTLQEDLAGRWETGNNIQMATGVGTKNYNCFMKSECVSTQDISIIWEDDKLMPSIIIGGYLFSYGFYGILGRNDGFTGAMGFLKWFNKDFHGKIIHWTDFKYGSWG
jgi:hypothetical protein